MTCEESFQLKNELLGFSLILPKNTPLCYRAMLLFFSHFFQVLGRTSKNLKKMYYDLITNSLFVNHLENFL